ncbi:MAG: hypothetical protein HUU37_04835 [Bdellovibrionales bacterium]|nr:hypothetical protein [Bdellovibrionales bacterium]
MKRIQRVISMLLLALPGAFFGAAVWAAPLTPQRAGMGGAGRGGQAREGIATNPATVAAVAGNLLAIHYGKPGLQDRAGGGRMWGMSVYDGQSTAVKAGVGSFRESRAADFRGQQIYVDRSEARLALARPISGSVVGGVAGRYVTVRDADGERKFADGDVGILTPLFADIMLGLTWENVGGHQGEDPPMVGGGLAWTLSEGVSVRADGGRYLEGDRKGQTQWQAGAEASMMGGLVGRLGLFSEPHRDRKGKSFGAGWVGPRASFDWAMVLTTRGIREKTQILGMTVAF